MDIIHKTLRVVGICFGVIAVVFILFSGIFLAIRGTNFGIIPVVGIAKFGFASVFISFGFYCVSEWLDGVDYPFEHVLYLLFCGTVVFLLYR